MHSIDRLVRYRLAAWHEQGQSLDVFRQAPGLLPHHLERLPEWTRQAHERLLGAHLQQVVEHDEIAPKVAAITARLDRLQRPRTVEQLPPNVPARAVGR